MTLPSRFSPGDRPSAEDMNRIVDTVAKLDGIRGVAGTKIANTPGGISVATAISSRGLIEAATAVLAANDSDVTLPAYAPCGLSGHLFSGSQAESQRVLLVRLPTDDDQGRFAVTAEPIAPGKIGRVYIAGLCLCRIQNSGDAGELQCAEIEADADYLIAKSSGGAQIIWEDAFEGDEIHLGLVRFPRGGGNDDIYAADVYRAANLSSRTGQITVEGVTVTDGTILLVNQTNPAQNGVWQVSSGPWTYIGQPKIVHILKGNTNGGGSWRLTAPNTYSACYAYWG